MKKSIIILLMLVFILAGCNKTEPVTTEEILPVPMEEKVVNTEENIPEEVNSIPTTENTNTKEIKIYSPVYTLIGETLSGTTKVEVVFSGSTKKDTYLLKQFKIGDKEFLTNLRLDYENIEKGENNYEVKFYDEKGEVIGKEKYIISANFKEVKIGGTLIYINLEDEDGTMCQDESKIFMIEKGIPRVTENDCLTYSLKNNYYLEIRNIPLDLKYKSDRKGTVYINGIEIVKDFPFGCWGGCSLPEYNKEKGVLKVLESDGDMCVFSKREISFNLDKKTFSGTTKSGNFCLGLAQSHEINIGYRNNDKNGTQNTIYTYDSFVDSSLETKDNYYSVFSISKGDLKRNYIYDSKLKLETTENFNIEKDKYTYTLGGKEIIFDFNDLKDKNEKMKFLYGAGFGGHFDYMIYLQKNNNDFSIHFNKIDDEKINRWGEKKIVKDIGITSCSGNNSKKYDNEYILKTKDQKGNYKYNISETLNNTCEIPYKINVYYTDGTKETGEYYILFDY